MYAIQDMICASDSRRDECDEGPRCETRDIGGDEIISICIG